MQTQGRPERSILVVDDEPLIRLNLADFFSEQGYQVFEAEDAGSAIIILEQNPSIDIVLSDVQMPGSMDGVKLAHFVRDRYPPTVLIVASGALKLCADELPDHAMFVAKPFDPHFVLEQIQRIV